MLRVTDAGTDELISKAVIEDSELIQIDNQECEDAKLPFDKADYIRMNVAEKVLYVSFLFVA